MIARLFLSTIVVLAFACGNHDKGKQQQVPAADKKTGSTAAQPAIQPKTAIKIDTLDFDTLVFSQVLQDSGSRFRTEDDCRCYQALFYRTKQNEFVFKNCDSIYTYSRYRIVEIARSEIEYIVRGKIAASEKEDTIYIWKVLENPAVYRIKRSNFPDVETEGFFIMKKDSARFKHVKINCDEDQG